MQNPQAGSCCAASCRTAKVIQVGLRNECGARCDLCVRARRWWLAATLFSLSAATVASDTQVSQVDVQGVVHLPAASIPASSFLSPEAKEKFIKKFAHAGTASAAALTKPDPATLRRQDEEKNAPFVARARQLWPVNIEPKIIGGVHTLVITPQAGLAPQNHGRVLINLHGGGFMWGEGNGAKSESIPIAGVGRITVITVAYRMAPQYHFPAASEDVAAVYRELLKDHRATDIGIYGCSAGGILSGEAVAWFLKENLPVPGAIGTFCGSVASPDGDSSHLAAALVGEAPLGNVMKLMSYFAKASASDPLVLPINSPRILEKFPPTLLIAGSRDFMVSSLFRSQAALSQVGVDAELHVWDGMWHAFLMDPDLPESKQVYQVIVSFFDRHLGRQ
jgi:monoterpene epsilon-lactone hydrolase